MSFLSMKSVGLWNPRVALSGAVVGSTLLGLGAFSSAAWGQAVPVVPFNAGNAEQGADAARRAAPRSPTGTPVLPQVVEPQLTLKGKETLFIRSFVVDGPSLIEEAEVRKILAPYENRKLTLALIYEAADKITNLYRSRGYLVAKVYVPAQDARSGTLHLKLLPGKYGKITLQNASLVRDDFLQQVIKHAIGGAAFIQQDQLERASLLITDLSGAGAPRVVLGAGADPGTSDFVFVQPEGRRVEGFYLADNYGAPWVGRDRMSGGLNVNSPLGFGDRFSLYGIVSQETHLINGRAAYSFPIGFDGLHGEVAAYRTTYSLGGVFAATDATGIAQGVSGTLIYPILRLRSDSVYISAAYNHRFLNDEAFGTSFADRSIDFGTVGVTWDAFRTVLGLPLSTSTNLSFTAGNVDFPDATQRAFNMAGPNTVGMYEKINLNFTSTFALSEKLSVSTLLRAQKSISGNLDSSEQLSLTGFYGVRSYNEGLTGDSGYFVTPEIKYALPDIQKYRHSIGAFTDVGAVWLENGAYTVSQRTFTQLNDVGLGYYGTYEYSPGRFVLVKAHVAHTYGSEYGAGLYDEKTKGLVQIGVTY